MIIFSEFSKKITKKVRTRLNFVIISMGLRLKFFFEIFFLKFFFNFKIFYINKRGYNFLFCTYISEVYTKTHHPWKVALGVIPPGLLCEL